MLKAVLFDLDGTLLPMNELEFTKLYFYHLYQKVKYLNYDKDQLIQVVLSGTELMYKNDGTQTNEEAFWSYFSKKYGEERLKDKAVFDDFYVNEFKNLKSACGENNLARSIVDFVKSQNLKCVLSTNPIFPYKGTLTRMSFVDLKESDFDFITAYENSSYAKPNPKYFEVILKKYNLKPDEVILFGNNDVEDYLCAKKCGIACYLVKPHLILHKDLNLKAPQIEMDEIIPTIKQYLKEGD